MANFDEKTLVQKLDKILRKEFDTNISFREFSAGYGIADLVFASGYSFSKRQCIKRTPITNFTSLKILFSLQENKIYSKEEIVNITGSLDRAGILKQLLFLVKSNYLEKISRDGYRKKIVKDGLNPIKKIIAIEVKLKDYKNGLIQAKRYQYFADQSYLAILKEAERNINMDEFNKQNIGLILFDAQTNNIEIKHPQTTITKESSINVYAKELMIEKYINVAF